MSMERDPMVEALDFLTTAVDDCDQQLVRLVDDDGKGDPVVLVPVLQRLRVYRQRLGQVEAMAERAVTTSLGTGKHAPGGVAVEVHGGWKRTDWQHREIGRLLAENALVDEATGEVSGDEIELAMRAVYKVLDAGRMDWRVTDLRAAGLSMDGLCKEEPKRMTVQFLTAAEQVSGA